MPIKNFLEEENYNLEIIKKDEFEKIKTCDVVISGVGKPYLIEKKFIKPGSVLIDYGCSFVGGVACGDFDPECSTICSYFTPVPGCMGPLVVACLFENVLKSAIK
jgi:methylenetetrahydrofolate dehydrogenase (NADP+)/methenyltetrahydrofolate cyclohydrolase